MPASPKQTIFISHSSLNARVTKELYAALTGRFHLDCWLDAFDLHADGSSFSAQIINALRGSSLLVLVDSPAARASDYVAREVQAAKDLQKPIRRCSIDENQPALLRKIKIQWLALTIQLRLARGFLLAAMSLILLLAGLAVVVFILGSQVAPALAQAARNLPGTSIPTPTPTAIPTPSDPKLAAPFHFKPDTVVFQDDFITKGSENDINDPTYPNILPNNPQVQVSSENGSLVIDFPVGCLDEQKRWECRLRLNSKVLDASAIQYLGFRARTAARSSLRSVSVSLSTYDPLENLSGFGWNLTDYAMAYFRSIPPLPEKELYAYVPIDMGWHAYEILRDPQKPTFYYYIDGQLVDKYTLVHAREWDQAPLHLIIFSDKGYFEHSGEQSETRFELEDVIVGGFKSQ
jgi:hypothetical protein